jgi:nicotinate-nucleotide--dimethylbenzimidazole phosphoribosyltransferase
MKLLQETIRNIKPQNLEVRRQAKAHLDDLTMPHWAMGRLMDLAMDLAGMTDSLQPAVARRAVVVMAGDHGVAAEGVSKYPQVVTIQQIINFVHGGAGCSAMARVGNARVVVVDMGIASALPAEVVSAIISCPVGSGTANIAQGPAMTREQAIQSLESGIRVAQQLGSEIDVFATGEMGIANTTPSSAIYAAICGCSVEEITGPGSGLDDKARENKVAVVMRALVINHPDAKDGLDLLAKIGGFEIGGLAGLILGAAAQRKPVVIDGFITTAAALIAQALCPAVTDSMIASHQSPEIGHAVGLRHLGKKPLLNLGLRLGEGTGAALTNRGRDF